MPESPIQLDTRQVKKIERMIKTLVKLGADVEKPLKEFNVYHISQTIKGFSKSRRGIHRWKKPSKTTLAIRKHAGISGTKPLVARGRGKMSIQGTVMKHRQSSAAVTFTREKHMKVHQDGGLSTIPARKVTMRKSGATYTRQARTIKVPQRKYLHFTGPDVKVALKRIMISEVEAMKKAGFTRAI